MALRRKFDYRKKKYSNPLFRAKKRRRIYFSNKFEWSWRLKTVVFLIFIIFTAIVWFFYFSSYFNITIIKVHGNQKISSGDIEELIWRQTNEKRFLIGSQKNLNLFNKNKLAEALSELYYFENLTLEKKLPNTITINIKEKDYFLIWYEDDEYYYVDNGGNIISEADPLEIKQKSYPLIENRRIKKIYNEKVGPDINILNYTVKLYNEFKVSYKNFNIDRFILDSDINTVKIVLLDGPIIYFNTEKDINKQITKLTVIVNEKLKDNVNNKTYIDLRYGDRVYYR